MFAAKTIKATNGRISKKCAPCVLVSFSAVEGIHIFLDIGAAIIVAVLRIVSRVQRSKAASRFPSIGHPVFVAVGGSVPMPTEKRFLIRIPQ